MNVAIVSEWFGEGGGSGVYSKLLGEVYREIKCNVIKVSLISDDGGCFRVSTDSSILGRLYDQRLTQSFNYLKEKNKIDFIHANILNASHGLTLVNAFRKLNLPYILTVHSYIFLCPIEMFCNLPELIPCKKPYPNVHCIKCIISYSKAKVESLEKNRIPLSRILYNMYSLRYLMKNSKVVISPSKDFAVLADKTLRLKGNMRHILNPIKPSFLENSPYFEGDGSVFYWGRLEFAKGAHLLISLAKALAPIKLHVIGHGRLSNLFQQNNPSNIVYHGYLEKPELIKAAQSSSVVVVPSIGYEMSSYTTMEAFALGKPVVAFDIGGPKEHIEASGGGLLAKPFNMRDFYGKVKLLLDNPSEALMMGKHGRKYAENFLHPLRYSTQLKDVVNNLSLANI